MLTSGTLPVITDWCIAKHILVGRVSLVLIVPSQAKIEDARTRDGMAILVRKLLFVGVRLSIVF